MDETEELIALSARALVAQMHSAPGVEIHLTRNCALVLTEAPVADFNRITLGAGLETEAFLVDAVARAKARGRPLLATVSPTVAKDLMAVATRLGFTPVGTAPLMVLRSNASGGGRGRLMITRALEAAQVQAAGDLIAAAFGEPRHLIARYIESGMTATSGVETYVGYAGARAVCTASVTITGDTGAVSLMATPPGEQRKGFGRDLLRQVIADCRRRGVTRLHLGSTDAGRSLYASLGFALVADLPVWLLDKPSSA